MLHGASTSKTQFPNLPFLAQVLQGKPGKHHCLTVIDSVISQCLPRSTQAKIIQWCTVQSEGCRFVLFLQRFLRCNKQAHNRVLTDCFSMLLSVSVSMQLQLHCQTRFNGILIKQNLIAQTSLEAPLWCARRESSTPLYMSNTVGQGLKWPRSQPMFAIFALSIHYQHKNDFYRTFFFLPPKMKVYMQQFLKLKEGKSSDSERADIDRQIERESNLPAPR